MSKLSIQVNIGTKEVVKQKIYNRTRLDFICFYVKTMMSAEVFLSSLLLSRIFLISLFFFYSKFSFDDVIFLKRCIVEIGVLYSLKLNTEKRTIQASRALFQLTMFQYPNHKESNGQVFPINHIYQFILQALAYNRDPKVCTFKEIFFLVELSSKAYHNSIFLDQQ